MKITFLFLGFIIAMAAEAAALNNKRAWARISDPLWFKITNMAIDTLPTSGVASNTNRYWSSDFWSKKKGGINYRWNAERPAGFNLRSPTKEEALAMTSAQLAGLAATEKLDLLAGAYDYPLKKEISRYASPSAPKWEGICNGWSEAAMHHDEPKPVTVTNADGVAIPFGSSDIKALLSWYYFRKSANGYARMGNRCRQPLPPRDSDDPWDPWRWDTENCSEDMNAGAFHLVLGNIMGLEGKSFIADMDRGEEVWNHNVVDYTSEIKYRSLAPKPTSAPGTRRVMRIKTVVHYTFILTKNSWDPVLGTENQKLSKRTYEYYLDIDRNGQVIGGDWITQERPDFLWTSTPTTEFSGNMAKLAELVTLETGEGTH